MDKFFGRNILHLFFPFRCPVCGEIISPREFFCADCTANLPFFDKSREVSIKNVESFTAPFVYNEKISPAIFLLKNGIKGNSAHALGEFLAKSVKNFDFCGDIDFIVPVPMTKKDEKRRGFNQAVVIAGELSKRISVPVLKDAVIKKRGTSEQKTLSRTDREKNIVGAFGISDKIAVEDVIAHKNILVVDDVCTTGSTVSEVASVLKENGVSLVYCACCCKTV